jgi:hypothetical protein
MREIKFDISLKKNTFYGLLTDKSKLAISENEVELIDSTSKSIVSVILKNKIKALEIPGITFDVQTQWINPTTIAAEKEKQKEKTRLLWFKTLDQMIDNTKNIKVSEPNIEGSVSKEHLDILLKTIENFKSEDIIMNILPESNERIDKNVDNILIDVQVFIDNKDMEESNSMSLIKSVITNAFDRLTEEKMTKKAKSDAQ